MTMFFRRNAKFWCVACKYKTCHTCKPEVQTTYPPEKGQPEPKGGLLWVCQACGLGVVKTSDEAGRGEDCNA